MANFLRQNWLLDRRHVLKGLGVSLALPLLDCMRPLLAADKANRPKRSVFIYLPNGGEAKVLGLNGTVAVVSASTASPFPPEDEP